MRTLEGKGADSNGAWLMTIDGSSVSAANTDNEVIGSDVMEMVDGSDRAS